MGAATVTKEKIESLVDELIEKGQLKKKKNPE
jgi:polyhydroxyalkanoate synthesis regulator phasin